MGVEHGVEAATLLAAGQEVEPAAQPPDSTGLDDDDQEKDEDRAAKSDDCRSEVGRDGGIEVDRRVLRR
jgi:hypothetical protein